MSRPDDEEGEPAVESSDLAFEKLLTSVYDELRKIARFHRLNERKNLTLQTTALVHEAWLKLAAGGAVDQPRDERHMKALTSRVIRHVLVDHARKNNSQKRDGASAAHDPRVSDGTEPGLDFNLLDLNAALQRLASHSRRLEQVVEHRYFGGMNNQEIAETLGVSSRTVERDWLRAKAYLLSYLEESELPE